MASLDGAQRAAQQVEAASLPGYPNHERPSLKLAFWAATLSTQRDLDVNGRLLHTLRPFAHAPLPRDPHDVLAILKAGDRYCCLNDAVHVLYVEWAYEGGLLDSLQDEPQTLKEWFAWRQRAHDVLHGHGFGYKAVSFAALLLWPTECPLVPVDRHVVARLGLLPTTYRTLGKWNVYRQVEGLVQDEWLKAGQPASLGVWHWYKWEDWREHHSSKVATPQGYAKGLARPGECESHALLSPYAY